jgi:hypothetical protein
MSEAVYFTAPDGTKYRVLDVRMKAGAMLAANPPAPWATGRVFRPKQGPRRFYQFGAGESREPSEALLRAQLERAHYLPSGPPHRPAADPR